MHLPPSPEHLAPLSGSFTGTRVGMHRVAEQILAPASKPDNEIALIATPGGFGTPPFEHDGLPRQVRTDGADLVYARGERETRSPLTSLAAAGALVSELLPDEPELDPAPLQIELEAAGVLADWFALGANVLEALAGEAGSGHEPSRPTLWPEHFDIAIESGAEQSGRRANYGFSPGDEHHREPYLYVGPWRSGIAGELWNATGFDGAELGYAELREADDPLQTALGFCRARSKTLDSMEAGS